MIRRVLKRLYEKTKFITKRANLGRDKSSSPDVHPQFSRGHGDTGRDLKVNDLNLTYGYPLVHQYADPDFDVYKPGKLQFKISCLNP